MHKVDFKIRILTPLYMFGADQINPELRESSFKGMIRFWWRAVKCCDDYDTLKKLEENIFGGVSDESGKSKINILITSQNTSVNNNLQGDYNLKWRYNSGEKRLGGKHRGIGYLFYSMLQQNPKRKIYPKNYFKPEGNFNVSFFSRDENEEALKNAVAAFWCAIYLGGFGSRSRRGAGSLTVEKVEGNTYGLNFIAEDCKNREELIQWIEKNISRVKEIIKPIKNRCNGYSNISNAASIISKNHYSTWYEALADIGNTYADFRYNNKNDIESGIFGLPIIHSDKSKVEARVNKEIVKRRPSPLIFKILKARDGYYWMMLKFGGDFLPQNAVLIWNKNTKKVTTSLGLLNSFWSDLKTKNYGEHKFSL